MAYDAINPELFQPPIEYASGQQLASIYQQANSLFEKAQTGQLEHFYGTIAKYNPESNVALYTYNGYELDGSLPALAIQGDDDRLRITLLVARFNPESKFVHTEERNMLINAQGVTYESKELGYDIEDSGHRIAGFRYNKNQKDHIKVPKELADDVQKLINIIWEAPEPAHKPRGVFSRLFSRHVTKV